MTDNTNQPDDTTSGGTSSTIELPTVTANDLANASMPSERVGCIVLAAGTSSRFGDENKLLAETEGEALVRRAAATALASPVDEVVVVVGHEASAVREALSGLNVGVVTNDDYEAGQSTSVHAGVVAARERNWDAAVFALGDMPHVDPASIERLLKAYAADHATILAAAYDRKRGNPTLFDAAHFDALAAIEGDTGGRELIVGSDDAALVETDDPGVVRDVDHRDDIDRLD
ncbi:nucleotidyltransferase family protein [Halococcus saccharolyticus]|uniref:Molybdopterin-guanine dinucleotide biosynthesis protein A n=1 Tax=Halococcus saccharolyticus DSM 5350 TaxID=1227455 RepID=M0MFI1_9EURY|nr:nucleotidyltransferase family protein [Halococcus saccharolyticus]EMA43180.1 molybdopterin-guanine dinucleotide biosynthesis protein A [Halococcus saccharolyticus DSM 5350]